MPLTIDYQMKGFANTRNYGPMGTGANLGPRDQIGYGQGWIETPSGADLVTAHAGTFDAGLLIPEDGLIFKLPDRAIIFTASIIIGAGSLTASFCHSTDPADLVTGKYALLTLDQTRGDFTILKMACYNAPYMILQGFHSEAYINHFAIDTYP